MASLSDRVVEYILRVKDEGSETFEDNAEAADKTAVSMAGMAGAAGAVTAAVAAAGVAWLAFMQKVADARNELSDMSTRTGVAAQTLAGLELAAESTGLKLAQFEGALVNLPKRLNDAATKGGPVADALDRLGLSGEDAAAMLGDLDGGLRTLVDRLGDVESPGERAALATELFGKSGARLLQALGDGSKLELFIRQAERFGVDVGPKAAQAAADWQVQMAALKTQLAGFADSVGGAFGADGGAASALETLNFALQYTATLASELLLNLWASYREFFKGIAALAEGDVGGFVAASQRIETLQDMVRNAHRTAFDAAAEFQRFSDQVMGGGGEGGGAPPAGTVLGGITEAGEEMIEVTMEAGASLDEFFTIIADADERGVRPLTDGVTHLDRALDGLRDALGEGVSEMERLRLIEMDLDREIERGTLSVHEQAEAHRLLRRARVEAAAPTIQGVTGTAAAALTGNVPGALGGGLALAGVADPITSAIVTGVQVLATVGREGAESVVESITSFMEDVQTGLGELDELAVGLVDAIPEIIEGNLQGLAENLDDLIIALVEAGFRLMSVLMFELPVILFEAMLATVETAWNRIQPSWWGDPFPEVARAIWQGLTDWFRDAWATIRESLSVDGNLLTGGDEGIFGGLNVARVALGFATGGLSEVGHAIGAFQSGGYVPRTQLALLHQGERVVAKGGAVTGGARRNLGMGEQAGPQLTINTVTLDHDALPALVRQLEGVFGAYGRGSSPLFTQG